MLPEELSDEEKIEKQKYMDSIDWYEKLVKDPSLHSIYEVPRERIKIPGY